MVDINDKIARGTTIVGIVCKEGVIIGSESRATMGNFIASEEAKKVHKIDELIGAAIAGNVGEAQKLVASITSRAVLYKLENEKSMTPKAAANLLANIFFTAFREGRPYQTAFIVAGVDISGESSVYSLDAAGGLIKESQFASAGSGSRSVYSMLADRYREDISIAEGVDLAIRAIANAIRLDSASGNEIKVVTITKDGFVKIDPGYVKEKVAKFATN